MLSYIGSVCAPDKATLKAENHALHCTTAGPYNAISSKLLEVGSVCGHGPDLVGIHSISLAARYRVAACSSTLRRGLEMSVRHAGTVALLSLLFLPLGNISFFFLPSPFSQRMLLAFFLGWTVMTRLMMCRKTKNRKLPLCCFKTNSIFKTFLVLLLAVPRKPQNRSVVIVLRTSCLT